MSFSLICLHLSNLITYPTKLSHNTGITSTTELYHIFARANSLIQKWQNYTINHVGIQMPLVVSHSGYSDQLQSSIAVQRPQANPILEVDFSLFARNHIIGSIVVPKVTGFPWSDNPIVGSSNQNQLLQSEHGVSEQGRVRRRKIIVNVGQENAELLEQVLMVGIVPVISYGCMLPDVGVEQLISCFRY